MYSDVYIVCDNNSFSVCNKYGNNEVIDDIQIPHDESGIDTQNRIDILKEYISKTLNHN